MIPLLCRMWTELPQAVCVQDPQQLQRREEEATVKRLPARRHLVCRSSTFHWLQPGSAGGGGSAALAWNHSLVVFILVGFLVVVFFFEWVKMYAQTSLAVVQPQYTHTYTHTCTFCLMARGKPLDFSIRFKPTSRVTVRFSQAEQAHRSEGDPSTVRPIYVSDLSGPEQHVVQSVSLID